MTKIASGVQYPVPEPWRTKIFRMAYAGIAAFGAFALFLTALIPSAVVAGDWVRVLFFASTAGCFLVISGMVIPMNRNRWRRFADWRLVRLENGSTVILPWRWVQISTVAWASCLTVSGGTLAVGLWTGVLTLPLRPGEQFFFPYIGLILSSVCLVYLAIYVCLRRSRVIIASPTGVRYPKYSIGTAYFRWSEIETIIAREQKAPREPVGIVNVTLRGVGKSGKDIRVFNTNPFGIGGPALYALLKFYHVHPECRNELASGRSIDRIRDGSLLYDSDIFPSKLEGESEHG